jgi:hypothetical protein
VPVNLELTAVTCQSNTQTRGPPRPAVPARPDRLKKGLVRFSSNSTRLNKLLSILAQFLLEPYSLRRVNRLGIA